ncbi:ABC transporter ATP-binding protein [Candidatus Cytomitobacter indipagum]|uniref:ABC transporter ATP-binding protein n=1 Tax=Candidatus Cytomitobacter indipagum TaxID=2601575 RepID=A0A5C0UE07_9PROT|nr:ABC transporter ATP-binding protein [Candidatus Cytomitobacter indipagum]QEK37937.1 ABC transporter ATP-binding protein [Candidatus Cytomitobacter indipagum]
MKRINLIEFLHNAIKPYRLIFAGVILCVGISSLSVYGFFWSIKYLLDTLSECTKDMSKIGNAYKFSALSISFIAAYELSARIREYLQLKMIPNIKKNIIDEVAGKTFSYSYNFFQNFTPTKFVYSAFQVSESTSDLFVDYIVDFLKTGFSLTLACITLFYVNSTLGYLGISWILIWMLSSVLLSKITYSMSYKLSDLRSSLSAKWTNTFDNIDSVFVYNGVEKELEKNKAYSEKVMNQDRKLYKFILLIFSSQSVVTVLITIFAFFYMLRLFKYGLTTPGDFMLVGEIIHNISHNLWEFAQDLSWLISDIGRIRQGLDMAHSDSIQRENQIQKINFSNYDISMQDISFSYNDKEVFSHDGILKIKQGSKIALVGSSGSGKSTFVRLLLGLIYPQKGEIFLGQNKTSHMNEYELRENFALIPQDPKVFEDTILSNIRYGSFESTKDEAMEASQKAQIHDFIMTLPKQYETEIKNNSLSGGQRQRLMIARGLLRNAKIFIFDESTSALDTITERDILNAIEEIDPSKTKFIIAHRLYTIKNADHILVFDDGKIVQQGNHESLISKEGLYKELYQIQTDK